jgi:4-hydroxythreonine-4-phosphate dehydrogenase
VRIAVGKGSAYDLHLQRTIQHAQLVAAPTSPAVFSFFVEHQLEVAAGVKQQLEKDLPKFPGHRLLPERFMVIRQAMGVAKSRGSAARAALTQFVEQQKSIGFVAQALDRHQITGATVAPLNSTTTQAVQDNDQRPRLGLMLGDPTGIGPEVAIKLLNRPQTHAQARVLVVGDHRIFQQAAKHQGFDWPVRLVTRGQEVVWPSAGTREILMVDLNNIDPGVVTPGSADPAMGWCVGETLQVMTHMALNKEIDAVCFAPLNKGAINRGGWKYLDEHAMFADWNQHQGYYGEVNIIPMFCTFRVTSHVSLREAVDLVIPERIEGAVTLAHTVLKGLGHQTPRIGVAALNPHSGEGGLFGDEEITIIRPTLQKLTAAGLYTEGPYPSDTVFLKAKAGLLDAVVIMYHDQGQIATKLLGFSEGVTLTGGLKTIYTTPAHGTAYDIVGQNKADPGAMIKAFEVAVRLANRRRTAAPTAQSH